MDVPLTATHILLDIRSVRVIFDLWHLFKLLNYGFTFFENKKYILCVLIAKKFFC